MELSKGGGGSGKVPLDFDDDLIDRAMCSAEVNREEASKMMQLFQIQ